MLRVNRDTSKRTVATGALGDCAQADIFDGGFDGKLWRAESFRQQKQ